jgi:hypothetical protein
VNFHYVEILKGLVSLLIQVLELATEITHVNDLHQVVIKRDDWDEGACHCKKITVHFNGFLLAAELHSFLPKK